MSIIDTNDLVTQLRNRTIMRHNDDVVCVCLAASESPVRLASRR